ncbi:MAG: hypothetical protein L0H63_07835 [Nitrococcus sp.]|nr:hypothetical protein [Nitrococcus sp.]
MNNNRMPITLGTPFGAWPRLAEHLRQHAVELAEPAFSASHDRIAGIAELNRRDQGAVAMTRFDPEVDAASRSGADALLAELEGTRWDDTDPDACSTAGFCARSNPRAEFLVFFEPPELVLAQGLEADASVDPEALLQAWRSGAERILALVRRQRRRVLLIDAREAAAYPARLREVCAERFGIQFSRAAESVPDMLSDAVLATLASAWLNSDKQLRALYAELDVSCTPLVADGPDDTIAGTPRSAPAAALAQYCEVRRQRDTLDRDCERLSASLAQTEDALAAARETLENERTAAAIRAATAEAERDRLRAHGDKAQGTITELQAKLKDSAAALGKANQAHADAKAELQCERERNAQRLADLGTERDGFRSQSEQAQQEIELLLLQLHQVQEELEATFLKQQDTERNRAALEAKLKASAEAATKANAAAAEREAECKRLRQQSDKAQSAITELDAKLKDSADALAKVNGAHADAKAKLQSERERNAQRLAELEAERDRLHSQAKAAAADTELRQENELLLLQLHQVQEELEHYFLENQKLKGGGEANGAKPQPRALSVADTRIGSICEEVPFRHVNFTLRDAVQGDRRFNALDVRLVEHHGEPGLVLLAPPPGTDAPLSCWQESGEEGGRAFLLLHPRHKTSTTLFARMTTSDWLLANDIVTLMQRALLDAADARPRLAAGWGLVCQRLSEQLADLPPALRYDGAQVGDIVDADGQIEVTLRLDNTLFRQRACASLRVRLRLAGGGGVRADLPGSIVFLAPQEPGALPPLSAWPRAEEGEWAPEYALGFGRSLSGAEKKAQWQALDPHDREFVASLISRLPAALAQSWAVVPPAGLGPADLPLLADKMAREIESSESRKHHFHAPMLRRVGS